MASPGWIRHTVRRRTTDRRRHPRARRTAPQRISGGVDLEIAGIVKDAGECCGHVLGSNCAATAGAILHDECVVAPVADLDGVRKALVQGRDIRKTAAGRDQREGCAGPSAEEEQARVASRRIVPLLRFGIDVVEDSLAGGCICNQAIQRGDDDVWIHVSVVRQQRTDPSERRRFVVASVIPRQEQPGERGECRMVQKVSDAVVGRKQLQRPSPTQNSSKFCDSLAYRIVAGSD